MEKLYGKLIICIIRYFFSSLISFSYKLEMQNLSWPFQFPNYSHFQIFAESANQEMLSLSFHWCFIKNL